MQALEMSEFYSRTVGPSKILTAKRYYTDGNPIGRIFSLPATVTNRSRSSASSLIPGPNISVSRI